MSQCPSDSTDLPYQRTRAGALCERMALAECLTADQHRERPRIDHNHLLDSSRLGFAVSHESVWAWNEYILRLDYQQYDPAIWHNGILASLTLLSTLHAIGKDAGLEDTRLSGENCAYKLTVAQLADRWERDLFPSSPLIVQTGSDESFDSDIQRSRLTSRQRHLDTGLQGLAGEDLREMYGPQASNHVSSEPYMRSIGAATMAEEFVNPYTGLVVIR